ncbi:unnamed protein product [Urochloa decumbens]|uniref:F-box domain-containing protein n=1 Tax=Urochloa decumbens TaxID=240449 RepID=A0ABC8XYZ7_9POAL
MASPVRSTTPRLEPTESPRQPAALTDDLLEEIFLRLESYADLARASTACASFRRLAADPDFLRRFRSRHPPLLLGFLCFKVQVGCFQPVLALHPNAPAAHALGSAADFSFGFLEDSTDPVWAPCNVCDGRVLLVNGILYCDFSRCVLWDLAVCDPLSRQYLHVPRIPEDLLASVQIKERDIHDADAELVPSGDWEDTSFRVLRTVNSSARLAVCVFSSTSGCWSVAASTRWDALGFSVQRPKLATPQFVYGSCYWKVKTLDKLLKLDMNTLVFSTIDLPPGLERRSTNIAIVEAGEGNLGMCSQICDVNGTSVDYYIFMQNLSGRTNGWHMKNTTRLSDTTRLSGHGVYYMFGSAEGYVFILYSPQFSNEPQYDEFVCFSLEINTSNIERVSSHEYSFATPYFGFPPSMSPRRM